MARQSRIAETETESEALPADALVPVFMTQGPYAGRWMQVDQATADAAIADGWARETSSMTPEEEQAELERQAEATSSGEAYEEPESLTEWVDSLEPEPPLEEGEGEGEPEVNPLNRRKTRRSQRQGKREDRRDHDRGIEENAE